VRDRIGSPSTVGAIDALVKATAFGSKFVAFALVLLPVVFFLGLVTIVRLGQINWEDAVWVQGLNRLRHAYLEIAHELEPYFVTSRYDDDEGMLRSAMARAKFTPHLQGFVAIPGVIAVLDAVVAGPSPASRRSGSTPRRARRSRSAPSRSRSHSSGSSCTP
jgi:hypothetical protein